MEHVIPSPVGPIRLVVAGGLLCRCDFDPDAVPGGEPGDPVLAEAARQLAEYFAGTRRDFDLPLHGGGTPFQGRVWRALRAIPFGETRTYADIARALGQPAATRAVGAANGKNPIGVIVPCHRVIGSDGTLTGYAGGLPIKRWLLAHEARLSGGIG